MAYQIDKFNGDFLVTVDDQTINTTTTDLKLVGRNYAGYGEIQNENFVHLLENFASSNPPPRSLAGQVWYDSVSKKLKYFDGQKYKNTGGAEVSVNPPAGLSSGEFWFDNQEQQLYIWDGSNFVLVGPEKTVSIGDTLATSQVVKDVLGNDRSILKLISSNETVAIISKEPFTLNTGINPIPGFFNIRPGINLLNIDELGVSTTSNHRFWGTSSNSQRLNGFTSDDFLRSSNTEFRSQVKFLDSGIIVGDQNDLRIRIINGNEPVIENAIGGDIIFRITSGADVRDIYLIKPDGVLPGSSDLYFLGKPGIRWKEVNSETSRADTFYGKLIGSVETPDGPNGPLPLQITNLQISSNFEMVPPPGGPYVFKVDFSNLESLVEIRSGQRGVVDNFEINPNSPNLGNFTTLTAQTATLTGNVESTSTTTGTLRVQGGVGITGNMNVGGSLTMTATSAIKVPVGTTAQRPTPQRGMIRFNTNNEIFEGFNGVEWQSLAGSSDDDYGLVTGDLTASADYGGLF
jgi:hypothetical protein